MSAQSIVLTPTAPGRYSVSATDAAGEWHPVGYVFRSGSRHWIGADRRDGVTVTSDRYTQRILACEWLARVLLVDDSEVQA